MNDELGDRMKVYEAAECDRRLMPLLPAVARIDGRCFSGFTRGMRRPFDERLSRLMIETTRWLVEETNACVGYTQSDEISLGWLATRFDSEIFFGGRIQKMVSQLAALASVWFNDAMGVFFADDTQKLRNRRPVFDARAWNVPTVEEAANVFLWRELDATKNSVSMAAREHYSHRELFGKGRSEQQEMLFAKGVNWNDFPDFFKRGTYVQRRTVTKKFSAEELDKLPPLHDARRNPDLMVERNEYAVLQLPPLSEVPNRVRVLFFGEAPEVPA